MMHLQDIMNSINNMVVEQGETVGESSTICHMSLFSINQYFDSEYCLIVQSLLLLLLLLYYYYYYYYYYLDNIEAHVERAAVEVEAGRIKLGAAARYKVRERREETLFIIAFT